MVITYDDFRTLQKFWKTLKDEWFIRKDFTGQLKTLKNKNELDSAFVLVNLDKNNRSSYDF